MSKRSPVRQVLVAHPDAPVDACHLRRDQHEYDEPGRLPRNTKSPRNEPRINTIIPKPMLVPLSMPWNKCATKIPISTPPSLTLPWPLPLPDHSLNMITCKPMPWTNCFLKWRDFRNCFFRMETFAISFDKPCDKIYLTRRLPMRVCRTRHETCYYYPIPLSKDRGNVKDGDPMMVASCCACPHSQKSCTNSWDRPLPREMIFWIPLVPCVVPNPKRT
mmetsp:Transcript_29906/g.62516  ORF Transcript_29906/g.62516 Transcript_29906/m.62516 type:complete len:218 (-) Transcript_29906:3276-3929(-)